MIYVYIFVGVLIVCGITFCILYGNAILKPVIKMQKKGQGKRTKFIINAKDKGYEYYAKKVENWLNYNRFSKYKKKINGRFLNFYHNGCKFKFGFNYYKQGDNLVIEAWLKVLGCENPLTEVLYKLSKDKVNIVDVVTGNPPADDNTYMILGAQGKEEYINFLKSLISIPDEILDENEVRILEEIDTSKIINQKNEKKDTINLVLKILGISIGITIIFYAFKYLIAD